jgi:sarcosine oxidase subunit beta
VRLYQDLSNDFDYNIMYSERGHFTLAHTDAAMRTSRWRAEVNKHLGVNSELIYREDIARLCPSMNLSEDARYPVLGALYHPPGSIARHDAWPGACAGCGVRGVHIHTQPNHRPADRAAPSRACHTTAPSTAIAPCRRWRAPLH